MNARRIMAGVCGVGALVAFGAPQAIAAEPTVYDGLYVRTPVRSLFYPRGDCTREPYWVAEDRGIRLDRQLGANVFDRADARRAARVRFIGILSGPSFYGYQGGYRYEVEVRQVILASPAAPCP